MSKFVDIYAKGGRLPNPRGEEALPEEEDKEFKKELKGYRQEIVKTKLISELGPEPKEAMSEILEKQRAEITKQINEGMAPLKTILDRIEGDKEKREMYSEFVQPLREELKAISGVLQETRTSKTADPFELLEKYQEHMVKVTDLLKKDLGLTGTKISTQDTQALLTLEDKKLDRDERARLHEREMKEAEHRWEIEREERKHQWEIDMVKWNAEFGLKKQEFELSKSRQGDAAGALIDLAQSVAASIDVKGAGGVSAGAPVSGTQIPRQFKCLTDGCETIIAVPEGTKFGDKVKCSKCGAEYDFTEQK